MAERGIGRAADQARSAPARRGGDLGGIRSSDPAVDHASAIGNLETLRRLAAVGVQPKLDVSHPTDAHEVEADRVAEQVMAMPVDRAAEPATDEEEAVATRLDRATAEPEEEEEVATRLDRAAEPATDEEETVATRLDRAAEPATDEEETIATKAADAPTMTPGIESGINTSRAGGTPLDAGERSFFEPRFGRDLSDTKVHTDATAARLASDLNAQAFTVGRDIYMGAGRYQPGTESGRTLLAHELTHTVQQQPGAKLQRRPARIAVPNPTSASRQVQRAGGAAASPAGGAAAAADPGVINDGSPPTITYASKLKVPPFKNDTQHRKDLYTAHPPMHAHDYRRGNPDQATVWDNSLPDATMLALIQARLNNAGSTPGGAFVLKHTDTEYRLVGTAQDLVQEVKRPRWDREGKARQKDVDHVVELQVSGWTGTTPAWVNTPGLKENLELLDSQANVNSGIAINQAVDQAASATQQAYHRPPSAPAAGGAGATPAVAPAPAPAAGGATSTWPEWTKADPPSIDKIKKHYDMLWPSGTEAGAAVAGEPNAATNYWTWEEINTGKQLEKFSPDTSLAGNGNWAVFPFSSGGIPKAVGHTSGAPETPAPGDPRTAGWLDPFTITSYSLANPGSTPTSTTASIGYVEIAVVQSASGRRYRFFQNTSPQRVPITPIASVANAGYLDRTGLVNMWRAMQVRGFSPIEIADFDIDPNRGFQAHGQLLPSLPIFEELGIELVVDGQNIYLAKLFDIGDFKLPGPINITRSSVLLTAGTNGLGATGELALKIEDVGEGLVTARVDTEQGFALQGSFTFDPELFDPPSRIEMGYANGEFSGNGILTIGEDRVRGIKTATITVTYAQGVLTATGTAELDVPGLQRGTMTLTYSEEEGFAITGTFDLSPDVPGIRSGHVTATVSKGAEADAGWRVSAEGTAVPAIPGVDTQITVAYDDGIFTAEGAAEYNRGMLAGSLRIGATNRPVDESGNPGEGATPTLRAFGGGELTLTLAPWLAATAGVRLLPNGEIEVRGRIGLPSSLEVFAARRFDRNLFSVNLDIPIVGVAVAGQRIGIFATVGGGLDLTAGFGPGTLRDLHLEVTYNPDHESDTLVSGAAEFFVPADAGLRLNIHAGLGAGIPIVSATAGLEIGGMLGVEGAARAGVEVSWTPTQGLDLTAEAEIYAEPIFTFDITGYVLVEADLFLTTIELYSKRWRLAEFEYGSGLRLGARFPIHYREGQPFDVSLDDIQIEKPDIDPMQLLTGLIEQIA
ncbi:MAG TPA: DUF4157 domain-containing protein [Candidatus Limnocylindrales bacterium]|nr:DUF4157 domain-containing protein [Candidatus Limnocylindrales bacterium]